MNTITHPLLEVINKPRALDGDARAWAKDIVRRWEAGDLNNFAAYHAACEALNIQPGQRHRQRRLQGDAEC